MVGEVVLVGIEPKTLSLGEGLSDEVAVAAQWLVERLRRFELDRINEHRAA